MRNLWETFKEKWAYLKEGGVFGPSILYLRSTLNTESENISIDYDSISARVRDYTQ